MGIGNFEFDPRDAVMDASVGGSKRFEGRKLIGYLTIIGLGLAMKVGKEARDNLVEENRIAAAGWNCQNWTKMTVSGLQAEERILGEDGEKLDPDITEEEFFEGVPV